VKTYSVGGAVRDEMLGIASSDNDYVVVGANADVLLSAGYKKVGADFPVFMNEAGDQYALARRERKTGDGYLGFECDFGPEVSIEEDLYRRDFTMNAIAKDLETGEIVDPFGGRRDIEGKVIKHVSAAFAEDPLRVVRLVRFAARFSKWTVDDATLDVADGIARRGQLNQLPDSRLWTEVVKTFEQGGDFASFQVMLRRLKLVERCVFFEDLFVIDATAGQPMRLVGTFSPEETVAVLAVHFRHANQSPIKSTAVPTEFKHLLNAVTAYMFYVSKNDPADVYSFINRFTLADSGHPMVDKILRIAGAFQGRLIATVVDGQTLMECIETARAIRAADYPALSGKELGQTMDADRIAAIAKVLA